ncbi:MAG: hypothetical protein WCP07_10760, partial [bacterium]
CYATQNRQDAVKVLAQKADTIFVVGSQSSSNSRSLRQVAAAHGAKAFLIDGAENITDQMLEGATVIGVTAGASAPEDIVQKVIVELQRRGVTEVENFVLMEEDVEFKAPPGLIELFRKKTGNGKK